MPIEDGNDMKILILSKYAISKEMGFETRLFALSRIFVQKGHDVNIISSVDNYFGKFPSSYTKKYNYQVIDGIKVIWIKSFPYKRTASIRRILSWVDYEWKLFWVKTQNLGVPDVIIVSSLSLLTILNGLRLKRKFGCKLIFEIRDIWPLTMVAEGGYSPLNPFVKLLSFLEKLGYKKSDLTIGTMPNLVEHANKVTQKEIKCYCVPFGFYLSDYNETNTTEGSNFDYGIPSDKFVIGYAGSIGLSNGLDTFIEVIKRLKGNSKIHFVILGKGALRETYMNYLKDCSNVQFIAKVERDEVKKILARCNLLYFAALNSEVWKYGWSPNKLIDYMISGKPVLASYSGYQSMINEANSGFFLPAEDQNSLFQKIQEVYLMPSEELEAMGRRGKEWIIQNRQWETLADQYLTIMKGLVDFQKN
jgi:glycosyltransferase involved in cell wall biosynthesis